MCDTRHVAVVLELLLELLALLVPLVLLVLLCGFQSACKVSYTRSTRPLSAASLGVIAGYPFWGSLYIFAGMSDKR